MDLFIVILLAIVLIAVLPVMYLVHLGLNRCYFLYVQRYCSKHDFKISRYRLGSAFQDGVKTEYSLMEIDCLDNIKQHKLIRLVVWIFGIRSVSIESFPDQSQDDSNWIKT